MAIVGEPIDVVFTWVDGSDQDYARGRDEWARRCGAVVHPERDRDELQLLRYSLRSLECYAPWVERIFLVTQRPQVPPWLQLDGQERLRVVHHDEFFQGPEQLPTYNSNAIDWNLSRIPGLNSRFWFFNDDYLLGHSVRTEHLLTPDGRIRVYLPPRAFVPGPDEAAPDLWAAILQNTGRRLEARFPGAGPWRRHEHTPCLLPRDLLRDEPVPVLGRFRSSADVALETFASHLLLQTGAQSVPGWEFRLRTSFQRLDGQGANLASSLFCLRWKRPRFFCLNDDMGAGADETYLSRVRQFLEEAYPRKSSWEK